MTSYSAHYGVATLALAVAGYSSAAANANPNPAILIDNSKQLASFLESTDACLIAVQTPETAKKRLRQLGWHDPTDNVPIDADLKNSTEGGVLEKDGWLIMYGSAKASGAAANFCMTGGPAFGELGDAVNAAGAKLNVTPVYSDQKWILESSNSYTVVEKVRDGNSDVYRISIASKPKAQRQ